MAPAQHSFDRNHMDKGKLEAEAIARAKQDGEQDNPYPYAFGWSVTRYHHLWLDYQAAMARVRELEARVEDLELQVEEEEEIRANS